MLRKQTNNANQGITDFDPNNPDKSLTRKGYAHYHGVGSLSLTQELIGNDFGEWLQNLVGDSLVVELGCGPGTFSHYCKNYIGLDGNRDAGQCCVGEFFAVDLTIPYAFDPPVEADFLMSFDFLEHIEEDQIDALLGLADTLIKPGAKIFLVVDKKDWLDEHITTKNEKWWDQKFQQVGWIKDEITKSFRNSYFLNMPKQWKIWEQQKFQMLFLYHRGIE